MRSCSSKISHDEFRIAAVVSPGGIVVIDTFAHAVIDDLFRGLDIDHDHNLPFEYKNAEGIYDSDFITEDHSVIICLYFIYMDIRFDVYNYKWIRKVTSSDISAREHAWITRRQRIVRNH